MVLKTFRLGLLFASVIYMLLTPVSAHRDVGCCGDIPESLIWTLSFFVLIGLLVIVGSFFFSAPPSLMQDDAAKAPAAVSIRIDQRDIEKIARAVANQIDRA